MKNTVFALRSHRELGHAEHVATLAPKIEAFIKDTPSVCADLHGEANFAIAGCHNSRVKGTQKAPRRVW